MNNKHNCEEKEVHNVDREQARSRAHQETADIHRVSADSIHAAGFEFGFLEFIVL